MSGTTMSKAKNVGIEDALEQGVSEARVVVMDSSPIKQSGVSDSAGVWAALEPASFPSQSDMIGPEDFGRVLIHVTEQLKLRSPTGVVVAENALPVGDFAQVLLPEPYVEESVEDEIEDWIDTAPMKLGYIGRIRLKIRSVRNLEFIPAPGEFDSEDDQE